MAATGTNNCEGQRLPERRQPDEAVVSRGSECQQEMDDAAAELEPDFIAAGYLF